MLLVDPLYTPDRQQSKTLILLMKVDQKLLETEFSIAICRPAGDKWQAKTLFLAIFEPCLLIVKILFDCSLSAVLYIMEMNTLVTQFQVGASEPYDQN